MFFAKQFSVLLVSGLAIGPVAAQEYTDSELLGLFETQRDAFGSATNNELGKTRGLTLVTVDDVQTSSETQPLAQSDLSTNQTGDTVTIAGADTTTLPTDQNTALATVQPVVFGKLAPELQVNIRIDFGFDSAALDKDQLPKLAQLCKVMKDSDINQFRIVGHTDSSGSDTYNEKLSLLRAEEVRRYLVSNCGMSGNRLEAIGLGERFPFNPDQPRADDNRRVEFQALS